MLFSAAISVLQRSMTGRFSEELISTASDFHWFIIGMAALNEPIGILLIPLPSQHEGPYEQKNVYPLVICYIANWKITIFHGKIHYFYGHFQ